MKAVYRAPATPRSFRLYLQEQLAQRCARNPHYSLRAFANYLSVNHSTLSQILRGKRTLTAEAIEKFGFRLGLSEEEIAMWVEAAKLPARSSTDPKSTPRIRELARDASEAIEDWRDLAILELTRLTDFQPDSRWIARMLAISVDEVNICISRLCRLGLLEMVSPRRWVDRLGDAVLDPETFEQAVVRNLSEQVSRLRSAAPGTYDLSAVTVALPVAMIPAVVDRIAHFRSELLEWIEAAPEKQEVYQLEIRFVPVTRRPSHSNSEQGRTSSNG